MILTDRQHNQHLTAETWSGEESSNMGRVREDCLSFLIQKSEGYSTYWKEELCN